jgi:hypothetical protein
MPRWREAVAAALLLAAGATQAASFKVDAVNASVPTQCAETDNVYVKFLSPRVRRFTVEAVHPEYLAAMTVDDKAPDFGKCGRHMKPAADHKFTPRQVVLYQDAKWELRGFTYPNFWRPNSVSTRVGDRVESGLHLLQLWTRDKERNEEVLVLYPADGYWRARPLAPLKLGWEIDPLLPTAYGSSFIVGPIERTRRPFVNIKDVVFDPAAGAFHLNFVRGGAATVRIAALDTSRISLNVILDKSTGSRPVAALRSMFVTADNADVAEIALDGARAKKPIMKFRRAQVSEFWMGRSKPSRHNTSAPDMVFRDFRD